MRRFKLIAAVLVIAGLGCGLWLQHSSNANLRRDNDALRAVIAELRQSQETGEPAAANDASTKEELTELLRLRGEVTQLRGKTNQIASLAEANQKLLSSMKELQSSDERGDEERPAECVAAGYSSESNVGIPRLRNARFDNGINFVCDAHWRQDDLPGGIYPGNASRDRKTIRKRRCRYKNGR